MRQIDFIPDNDDSLTKPHEPAVVSDQQSAETRPLQPCSNPGQVMIVQVGEELEIID